MELSTRTNPIPGVHTFAQELVKRLPIKVIWVCNILVPHEKATDVLDRDVELTRMKSIVMQTLRENTRSGNAASNGRTHAVRIPRDMACIMSESIISCVLK
jgi:hypothetical protein